MNVIRVILMFTVSLITATATFLNDNLLSRIYDYFTIITDGKKLAIKFFISFLTLIILFCLQLLIDKITFGQIYKKQLDDINKNLQPKNIYPIKVIQKLISQFNEDMPIEFEKFYNKYIGVIRKNKKDDFRIELGKLNECILRKTTLMDEILIDTDIDENKINCESKAN